MPGAFARPTDAGEFGAVSRDATISPTAVQGGFRTNLPAGLHAYAGVPPLRADPFTPDDQDGNRVAYNLRQWRGQDHALRRRDRQVEENIRVLAGQHWTLWNPWLQKFQDVSEWMTDDERRWRQRPVVNRVLYWYILTHARLTENPPILTFQPSNADRLSADLAEVQDTIFKSKWRELGMPQVIDDLVAWLCPGGRAFLQSGLNAKSGPVRQMRGDGIVPVLQQSADGQFSPVLDASGQPVHRGVSGKVGFKRGPDGKTPIIVSHLDPNGNLVDREPPETYHEGDLDVNVLSPVQVRGEWGPTPWHKKRWHMVRYWLTPEEVYELFGVDEVGETASVSVATSDPGFLQRMFFGSGYYGAASDKPGSEWATMPTQESYVEVFARWEVPSAFPGTERRAPNPDTQDPGEPGGRLLITTKRKVLRDGTRPFDFQWCSSLRKFDFVNVPGRPAGTTPLEMLVPLNRSYNRFYAQIFENATLHANPIRVIDQLSGLGEVEMTNKPGESYVVMMRPNVDPVRYVQPPSLGRDVYQAQQLLMKDFQDLGHLEGAEGRAPTPDPSGKLIRELRFNSDRFLGPTARRMVEEIGRMADDWMQVLKVCWDEEKILHYAGDDTIPRTISVLPEMFVRGAVHVIADVESMLPQSRAERQSEITTMYQMGAWGQPGTPGAVQKWLELARFPHLGRSAWPAGQDVTTAQQENGKLIQGVPAEQIPIFEWYDNGAHLAVHEDFMKSAYYLRLSPQVQQQFAIHRQLHKAAEQQKLMAQAVKSQELQGAVAAHGAMVARAVAGSAPGGAGTPQPGQGVEGDAMSTQEQSQPAGAGAGEE